MTPKYLLEPEVLSILRVTKFKFSYFVFLVAGSYPIQIKFGFWVPESDPESVGSDLNFNYWVFFVLFGYGKRFRVWIWIFQCLIRSNPSAIPTVMF